MELHRSTETKKKICVLCRKRIGMIDAKPWDEKGNLVHEECGALWRRLYGRAPAKYSLKVIIRNLIFRPGEYGITYTKRWKLFKWLF